MFRWTKVHLAPLAVAMLVSACGATARWQDSDCRLHQVSAKEFSRIEAAAKPVVGAPVNRATLYTCRHRARNIFVASFDTVHVAQADGAERWQSLSCRSDYRRRAPWACERWSDARGIRRDGVTGSPPMVVVIPPDIDVMLARRRVEEGFSLIDRPGEAASCDASSSMKTLPELRRDASGEKKDLAALRDYLRQGEGTVILDLDPDGFALSRFPLNIHFVFEGPDGAPQVRCWSETDVVVTS
jgi:hypothetical protein